MKRILFAFFLLFCTIPIVGLRNVEAMTIIVKNPVNVNAYDTNIWNTAKIWHGGMPVKDFAVLLKAHCLKESNMRPYVTRTEAGYFTGHYQHAVTKMAVVLQKSSANDFGIYQSVYTWRTDLSKSYGLCQIMLQRAAELGWRGPSAYDEDLGLINIDVGLYYGAKLININLSRYQYNVPKAISAYNSGSYTKKNAGYVKDVMNYVIRFQHDFDTYSE